MRERFPSPSPRAGGTDLCGVGTAAPTAKCHIVCARVRRLHCAASLRGGGDSLAANAHPCARTDAFCRCRKSRVFARPPISFSAHDAPPCRKGDKVEQKLRFCRGTGGGQWGRGAFCAHRDDEGLKWTAVVQVGFHENLVILLFVYCKMWLFGEGSLLFTQKKSSCRSHRVYLCTECHLTATNVPVAERERSVAR